MAQITHAERVQRIKSLLNELNKVPPERHEVKQLPGRLGKPLLCQVITIGVDDVLLNHNSHRLRAQLQDNIDWQEQGHDPHGEAAQRILERLIRESRSPEQFAALKDSLERSGQDDPGVITHEGVLVNANTRAVALREFEDPSRRYIRVAVLPETINPEELALLELRLQMQKELKVEYSLTNELLFIEELSSERGLSDSYIAQELRIYPESPKKGEAEVRTRLQMLDLIREMQRIPKDRVPLTFFDSISYEQLRELIRIYVPMLQSDPVGARRHLESFLLSVAVGVTPLHQLRRVDGSFMSDYMLPQLEEDEVLGPVASQLAATAADSHDHLSENASQLLSRSSPSEASDVNVQRLIDAVTQRDRDVEVPGTVIKIERDELAKALRDAIITGVGEKRRDVNTEDKLDAPITSVKSAVKSCKKAEEALRAAASDVDFDDKRRKSLEAAYKKLRRTVRSLEAALTKAGITSGT